jgi:hypothetical protein
VHIITVGMAANRQDVAEVHCFLTDKFIISLHDMVDAYRDLIGGATDTHLSMVSNRLNVIMKNFAWLQSHLQVGVGYFLFLGIGREIGVALASAVRVRSPARLERVPPGSREGLESASRFIRGVPPSSSS